MSRLRLSKRVIAFISSATLLLPTLFILPQSAWAAASLSISAPGSATVGDTVSITVRVNTGGQAANAFEGTVSYPSDLLDGVRGSFSGSICTLPISQPDPSGGTAYFSCGTPAGFNGTGTVATIVFTAKAAGSVSFGMSGCSVLAADGQGTDITGGCSGTSMTINAPPTPPPTPTPPPAGVTSTPTPKATAKPTAIPKTSAAPANTKPVETAKPAEATTEPTAPPKQVLPSSSAPAALTTVAPDAAANNGTGKRSIAQAFGDLFSVFKNAGQLKGSLSGVIALLLTMIPILGLLCAIFFMVYRLYLLERRRRRTLDRLFEMELSELAGLEGKMDLLGEKGVKGREQYREEFKKAKENILRQIKPDYNKPVDAPKAAPKEVKTDEKPANPEKKA
jgi:outer membrane biosynthesis protein TonB